MQQFDKRLDELVASGVAQLRARFPGCHVEWDLDTHDRFVIAEIMFDPESTRAEWLAALSEILDVYEIKAVAPLPNARHEVIDAFMAAGYVFDEEGNGVRNGLSRRDEALETEMTRTIRGLDGRYRDVYFEWFYGTDGAVVLQHIESGRNQPEERVEAYLRDLREAIDETGTSFRVEEVARTAWLSERLELAGYGGLEHAAPGA